MVQTRTFATGMLPATPVERKMWCRGGKKRSHLEGVKQHLGGKTSDAVYKWTDGLLMSLHAGVDAGSK